MNETNFFPINELVGYLTHPAQSVRDAAAVAYLNVVKTSEKAPYHTCDIEKKLAKLPDGEKRVEAFYWKLFNSINRYESNQKLLYILLKSIKKLLETENIDDAYMGLLALCINCDDQTIKKQARDAFVKHYIDYCYLKNIRDPKRIASEYLLQTSYSEFQILLIRLVELSNNISDVIEDVSKIKIISDPNRSVEWKASILLRLAEFLESKYNAKTDGIAFPKKLFEWSEKFPEKKEFAKMACEIVYSYRNIFEWDEEAVKLVAKLPSTQQMNYWNNLIYERGGKFTDEECELITKDICRYIMESTDVSYDAMNLLKKFSEKHFHDCADFILRKVSDPDKLLVYLDWINSVYRTMDKTFLFNYLETLLYIRTGREEDDDDIAKAIVRNIKDRLEWLSEKGENFPDILIKLQKTVGDVVPYCAGVNFDNHAREILEKLYKQFKPYTDWESRKRIYDLYSFIVEKYPMLKYDNTRIPHPGTLEDYQKSIAEGENILQKLKVYM